MTVALVPFKESVPVLPEPKFRTALAAGPRPVAFPRAIVPALSVTGPVNVFAWLMINVPAPVLVRPPTPEITFVAAFKVQVSPAFGMSTVPLPFRSQPFEPEL